MVDNQWCWCLRNQDLWSHHQQGHSWHHIANIFHVSIVNLSFEKPTKATKALKFRMAIVSVRPHWVWRSPRFWDLPRFKVYMWKTSLTNVDDDVDFICIKTTKQEERYELSYKTKIQIWIILLLYKTRVLLEERSLCHRLPCQRRVLQSIPILYL